MKTRIFAYLFALSCMMLGASIASAAAVIPLSSGIKNQFYNLEWCSPHASRLKGNSTNPATCRSGEFRSVAGVATISYDGTSFPAGGVAAQTNLATLMVTRTSQTINGTPPLVDFFAGITGGAFSLEGEGVLTLRVFMVDHAENTSFYRVMYKIDKTGPQLTFTDITENTDYTYYKTGDGRVNASTIVEKNDASATVSSGEAYVNPIIGSYAGNDTAAPRQVHTRSNLHAFYYQNHTAGVGANSPFSTNTAYSDSYGGYMTPSATSPVPGGYSGPLVAGERGFQLITEGGSPVTTIGGLSTAYSTANLTDNLTNTQKKYRLRLYDNSVSDGGTTGNYSETAFYVARDNVSPNMGGNGLGTTLRDASEMLLSFADNQTVYDQTVYAGGYTPEAGGVSRFFAAAKGLPINYKLNDTGITGNGLSTGNGCTDYKLCNAGMDGPSVRVHIEDADAPGTFPVFTTFNDRFVNAGASSKNFDKVDNALVSNGTYRKYGVRYTSNAMSKLCDYVGNCIEPQLAFRVVANRVDNATSNLTITSENSSVDGKIVANGTHAYRLSYALQDTNGNRVVPVVSMENAGTPQIKAVDTVVAFDNGLYENLLRNSGGSGNKLVTARNLRPTNITFNDQINAASGAISMTEGILQRPYGEYAMSLSSAAPTNAGYPYVGESAKLKVRTLENRTDRIQAAGAITYPTTGDRMGYAQITTTVGNTSPLVRIDRGNIGESVGFQNITLNKDDYGKVGFDNANQVTFASLTSRAANFEFASPYVYGLVGMRVLIDGQYGDHYKKLYTIDPAVPNYNIYEKYVVAYDTDKDEQPGVLDYKIRTSTVAPTADIESGVRYTANGNFPLFGAGMVYQPYNIAGATGSGFYVEVQMSSKPNRVYDNVKLRTGFVSAITYQVGSSTVRLPAVGRGLTRADGATSLDQYEMVRNYFDNTYTIGKGVTTEQGIVDDLGDIAIIGLSNRYNTITTDVVGSQKNVNVEGELNRTSLIANIKQNVATVSRGFGPRTNTSGKRWCGNGGTTTVSSLYSSAYDDCSVVLNGETIMFFDGSVKLDCGASACSVNDRRSVIVKNGTFYIKSNVTTLTNVAAQTNGQLFLGVMNDTGLANVTIDPTAPDIANSNKNGWMLIDPTVTNIDAFLFAQGPMVSYDEIENIFYSKSLTTERKLRNQLYINGSILTLNTITGSRQSTPECPYMVENCTPDVSQMFDLVYTRRFALGSISLFAPFDTTDTRKVPYHPDGPEIAKRAGGVTGVNVTSGNELRSIADPDYYAYPMLIERDTRWNSVPSRLFQVNR